MQGPINSSDWDYEFETTRGRFRVFLKQSELFRNDQHKHLEKKTFEILQFLIDNRDRRVSRKQIKDAMWGLDEKADVDQQITNSISKLRDVLGDSKKKIIVTHSRIGYRFGAQVV